METVPIKCPKCGKEAVITAGDGHTGILKCDCGATTTLKGKPLDILNEIKNLVPQLIEQWKAEKRPGVGTGIDQALHDASRKAALEILETNPELKSALYLFVEGSIRQSFSQKEDDA